MKRYRLNIKYPVHKKFLTPAYLLREYEGEEINILESTHVDNVCISYKCGYYFPESWLTEIKESLSFEEWDKSQRLPEFVSSSYRHDREITWNAAIENYKLSHDITEEKDMHAYLAFTTNLSNNDFSYQDVWIAALKYARGEK